MPVNQYNLIPLASTAELLKNIIERQRKEINKDEKSPIIQVEDIWIQAFYQT